MKSAVNTALNVLGILLAVIIGAVLCAYSTTWGATWAGLKGGGWGWQFLPFLCGGFAFGVLTGSLASIICFSRRLGEVAALIAAAMIPAIAGFPLGAATYVASSHAEQQRQIEYANRQRVSEQNYAVLIEKVRRDPEIVLRERWFAEFDERQKAFTDSLTDPQVGYSLSFLKKLYAEAPETRDALFISPGCDAAFLTEHFQEAWDRAEHINYGMLASIVSNPNTPVELVEKVAQSSTLPMGSVEPAQKALQARSQPR